MTLIVVYFLLSVLFQIGKSTDTLPLQELPEDLSNTAQFLPRILKGTFSFCTKWNPCTKNIVSDVTNTLLLKSNGIAALQLDLGNNKEALKITYGTDSPKVEVSISVKKGRFGGNNPNQAVIAVPVGQRMGWSLKISEEMISGYSESTLVLSVENKGDNDARVQITVEFEEAPILMIVLITIGALAVVAFLVLGTWYVRLRRKYLAEQRQRVRDHAQAQIDSRASLPMRNPKRAPSCIKPENIDIRFPESKFEEIDHKSLPQTTCSICLEELKEGQPCRQLYCSHIFHSECIKLWLVNRIAKGQICCPNCNRDVSEVPAASTQIINPQDKSESNINE